MKRSLRAKLILPIIVFILIPMIVLFVILFKDIKKQSLDEFLSTTEQLLAQIDNTFTLFFKETKSNVNMIAKYKWVDEINPNMTSYVDIKEERATLPERGDIIGEKLTTFLSAIKQSHPNYLDVYIGTKYGGFVIGQPSPPLPAGYDPRVRPWYKSAVERSPEAIISPAYISTTGDVTLSIAKAIVKGEEILGVAAIDVSLQSLTNMVSKIKLGKTGYIILVQEDGTILADPFSKKHLFKKIHEIEGYKKLFTLNKMKIKETLINNIPYLGVVYVSPALKWKLIGFIQKSEIMTPVYSAITNFAIWMLIIIITIVFSIWWLVNKQVLSPLNRVVDFLKDLSEGRYNTIDVDREDEIGIIFTSLNDTSKKLESNFKEIEKTTKIAKEEAKKAKEAMQKVQEAMERAEKAREQGIMEAATQLEDIVVGLSNSSEELLQHIEYATKGAYNQQERASEVATAMEEMNATVLEVAQNASKTAEGSELASKTASQGQGVVVQVIEAVEEIKSQADIMTNNLHKLGQQAEDIGKIINVINEIADQTNLLALNAAIEAARAGEAGRGFAVVADEVRKLAEKTMEATKEVEESIKNIQQGARLNIQNMELAQKTTEKATELAKKAGEALDRIVAIVAENSDQVRSIATAAEEQSAASEEINHSTSEINNLAGEIAEAMSMCNKSVESLVSLAQRLKKIIEDMKNVSK